MTEITKATFKYFLGTIRMMTTHNRNSHTSRPIYQK